MVTLVYGNASLSGSVKKLDSFTTSFQTRRYGPPDSEEGTERGAGFIYIPGEISSNPGSQTDHSEVCKGVFLVRLTT
jgi:hypothetical protein